MKHNLKKDQDIFFINENLPMKVMAVSAIYAICTRQLNWIEDNGLLMYKVEMQAYLTKKQAYHALKSYPVYSLLDFQEMKKAPDNYGGKFDYSDEVDCLKAIQELQCGQMELSRRHMADLLINWKKTKNLIPIDEFLKQYQKPS